MAIAACILSACSPMMFTYKGDKVTQKIRLIPLKQGEQRGVWKTNELSITYQYQMTPEVLKLSGTAELVGGFAIGFNRIKRLVVHLLFLDKQGIVIESPFIYSAGIDRTIDMLPMDFERAMPVPEGTQALSFAYDGELAESSGAEGATSYSIWDSPARP